MGDQRLGRKPSDAQRDAHRFGSVLLALEGAVDEIRQLEHSGQPDMAQILARFLPNLAEAFDAAQAFVATVQPDPPGTPYLALTAAYPNPDLVGRRLPPSPVLAELIADDRNLVIDPLGEDPPQLIPGLEIFGAVAAVLTRAQDLNNIHVVGLCNKRQPAGDPYLSSDGRLLDKLIELIAIGVRVGQRHSAVIEHQRQHWQALYEAGKALATGFTAERGQVLDQIVEQAVERLAPHADRQAVLGIVQLYNEDANELLFESAFPRELLPALKSAVGARRSLNPAHAPQGRIGITGRAVLLRRAVRVADVRTDPDYITIEAGTRAELAVPLIDQQHVIGVLSLESQQPDAFDIEDERALLGLAELAIIAIKNADRADHLSRVNAIAMMGAWGADMAHDINHEVGAIRLAAFSLRGTRGLSRQAKEDLTAIDRHAGNLALLEWPQRPPEPGQAVPVRAAGWLDQVVATEIAAFKKEYPKIAWGCDLHCPNVRVAIHEQWLRRLLRHLLHNAEAAARPAETAPAVNVRTRLRQNQVIVEVEDNGRGIAPDLRPLLFHQAVQSDSGTGRGLLLASFLVEQHGGHIGLKSSEPGAATCFWFSLPTAQAIENDETSA